MSLRVLQREQNNVIGAGFLLFLIASFAYGVYYERAAWLQWVTLLFTFYAVFLFLIPLLGKDREVKRNDFYRPFVSILVPAKNEEKVIGSTILSLARLQYLRNSRPNFEILVIDDGSTDQTGVIVKNLQRKLDFLRVITRPAGSANGKGAALNAGLVQAGGAVIAVFDADTQVKPDFLSKSIPLLFREKVAGVQGRVKLYNPDENLVTRLQNDEFLIFNHLALKGKDLLGGVACLGGNGQLVKREALEEVGGWNEESLTEDLDLTFRLLLHGYQIRYAEQAELWQEAIYTWKRLLRQRIRWGQGLLTALFDFSLPILSAPITMTQRVDGVLTLTRILLPFWVIQGYIYQMITLLGYPMFRHGLSPILLIAFTPVFLATMGLGIFRISPCSWLQMFLRVTQYWLYAVIWIIALPISYFNYFKTSQIYWDKTFHKGLEIETVPVQQVSGSLVTNLFEA